MSFDKRIQRVTTNPIKVENISITSKVPAPPPKFHSFLHSSLAMDNADRSSRSDFISVCSGMGSSGVGL